MNSSDITIDPETGLPELPMGHFWRIGDSVISIMKPMPAGEWSEWRGVAGPAEDNSNLLIKMGPWGIKTERQERTQTKRSRLFRAPVTVTEYRYRRAADSKAVYTKRYGEWDVFGISIRFKPTEPDPITRDNILERTTETYLEWRTEQALKEEREAIQGDYPPKRHGETTA